MKLRLQTPQGAKAGFSLVEVLVGALLLAGLLLVAGVATDRALGLLRQRRASEAVSSGVNRLLHRASAELAFARRGSLDPDPGVQGSSTLRYQRSLGVVGGVVQWGPMCTLRWEREPSELDDGLDNDNDGRIDEGQLVWIENEGLAGERSVVWGHGLCEFLPGESFDGADEDGDGLVDERGLCFSLDGSVLTIRIGLQGRNVDGSSIVKVLETSVLLRN